MSDDKPLLESLAIEPPLDHDIEVCGQCYMMHLHAVVAQELIAAGRTDDIKAWGDEVQRRWRESKYFRLWQDARGSGRDPEAAFKARGWEP